jgi:hypothetical protein
VEISRVNGKRFNRYRSGEQVLLQLDMRQKNFGAGALIVILASGTSAFRLVDVRTLD